MRRLDFWTARADSHRLGRLRRRYRGFPIAVVEGRGFDPASVFGFIVV